MPETSWRNGPSAHVNVEEWVARFRAIGLDDAAMERWHQLFEEENPQGHQAFLQWLGLPPERIQALREDSRAHTD
ncbi:MAG: hypothetical protein RBU37_16735 [Myxococcota bacterium]|jgi:hypothetical protein|nr:hypothetical protein [Myxococcota bacterium]